MICRVHDCQREAKAAHGMCWGHYKRWDRYGHPLGRPERQSAYDRVMARTAVSEVGCWLYDCDNQDRSPRAMDDTGRVVTVASILWERDHGPKPRRSRLDSLCGNLRCVKPDHHRLRELALSAASVA